MTKQKDVAMKEPQIHFKIALKKEKEGKAPLFLPRSSSNNSS